MQNIKRILFIIFKPLNPIDVVDSASTNSFTLLDRFKRLINGDLKEVLLIPKHLLLLLLSIFYIPFALILFFFKYKFLYVNFWQIGSPPQEIGCMFKFLKFSKFNTKKLIFLNPKLISDTSQSNKLYKSEIIVIENFFLYLILLPFLLIEQITLKPYLTDSSHPKSKYNLINKLHEKYSTSFEIFKIKKNDKKTLKDLKNNINLKKYIILNIRNNKKYFSHRNVNKIQNYKKTINYFLKKKYQIIRLLDKDDTKINIYNKNYSEIINSEINLYTQILLYKFAKFSIVTQSGPASYASILDTPFLLVNSIEINPNLKTNFPYLKINLVPKKKDLIIYKKINPKYLEKKNNKKDKYLDNTPSEILNAAIKITKNFKS